MRIDILTLFPESIEAVLGISIIGRAQKNGTVEVKCHQIRDYTVNKQRQTDDYPYGGGKGMVMYADALYLCKKHVLEECGLDNIHTIYMSPQGTVFSQKEAKRLVSYDNLILVCGHYEGVDQRFIDECVDEEISIGDYVITGGEIAAMAVADAVCRLVPGVLAADECFTDESHWDGRLEYPQYTRPEIWHDVPIPNILLSGHHANIKKWRLKQSVLRTMQKRPDLIKAHPLTPEEKKILESDL